ncbi:MAG: hypothetical protein GC182_08440 [Rhodopseudomonas sp.]|nr:hypothetical protein [Rhodopseudomonas sp.]
MEPAVIGAASGIVSAGFAVAGFWMMLGGRITKAEATADNALQVAATAENDIKECEQRVTSLIASFSLYRENAIEKFVTHHAIIELEKRLVESQAKSEQRLVDALEGLNKRLDRLLEAGLRH